MKFRVELTKFGTDFMTIFTEKFVAFVDVLGFKSLVAESERGRGIPLPELLDLLRELGSGKERAHFDQYGPTCCPMAPRIEKNLDFRVTQISDCVIASSEISPAGAINLISHCWGAVISLMAQGIMCRGYIKRGSVFHTDTQVIGSGYQDAYLAESRVSAFQREADERGTPYVEVDPEVTNYITDQSDSCVKTMFNRMVKKDGKAVVLFPFQRLQHSFAVGGMCGAFDPEKELRSNQNLRSVISKYKGKVMSFVDSNNRSAVAKAAHYIDALDAQLRGCDEAESMILRLQKPLS